jgi:ADP-ribosyl-[dinitrogen reductase] hydrolase
MTHCDGSGVAERVTTDEQEFSVLCHRTAITLLKPNWVERLGEEILRMLWFHLPIVDGSIPNERFEGEWDLAGDELRSILPSGSDMLVHCRGRVGRAGTIAARPLIELGVEPATAIEPVHAVRLSTI